MGTSKTKSGYGLHIHRVKTIRAALIVVLVVVIVSAAVPFGFRLKNRTTAEKQDLLTLWESGAYGQAFDTSVVMLAEKPLDYFLLTINGFSAYQLGISQINSLDTQAYIDACIRSLRKALLVKENDGRVYYMLGAAYYYKGGDYADLAVEYLEKAKSLAYNAADISEFLGLAYAAIGDYRSSVAAFSGALHPMEVAQPLDEPSDRLLLSIARSYIELEELETARAYLLRCAEISRDSKSILAARLFLAEVFQKQGDLVNAESQYRVILSEAGENAEAHYQLGELYSRQGDAAKARSEWRLAYRADPVHAKARARLNI